jgi:hypothetical protein
MAAHPLLLCLSADVERTGAAVNLPIAKTIH